MNKRLSVLGARYVLQDCREALAELEKEPAGAVWRVRWVAACTFLRIVGDVLESVDQQNTKRHPPELIQAIREHRTILKNTEADLGRYWSQIREQVNSLIHCYDFQARQGVLTQLSDDINPKTGIPLAKITGKTYDIVSGPFEGMDQRDFLKDAINWWDEQLSEIELKAAVLKIKSLGELE